MSVNSRSRRSADATSNEDKVLLNFSNEEIVQLTLPEDGAPPSPGHQTVVKTAVLDIAVSVCHRQNHSLFHRTDQVCI